MRVIRQISTSFFLFFLCVLENYINTFISLDYGFYVFFVSLLYIGIVMFNQNLVLPIFLTGILYDSFFSTYYLGLYAAIFIVIVVLSNFLVTKYRQSNIIYIVTIALCLLIYKAPLIIEFEINYWLSGYLLSIFVNLLIFLFLKRVIRVNV